jgi:hypothetical protein
MALRAVSGAHEVHHNLATPETVLVDLLLRCGQLDLDERGREDEPRATLDFLLLCRIEAWQYRSVSMQSLICAYSNPTIATKIQKLLP